MRKIRSSLAALLFAHGYGPRVSAGSICQPAKQSFSWCSPWQCGWFEEFCVPQSPSNIRHHEDAACWYRLDSSHYIHRLPKDTRAGSLFSLLLSGRREGVVKEIFGSVLCVPCPNHKGKQQLFLIALLACCSLHSCGARRSQRTDSDGC